MAWHDTDRLLLLAELASWPALLGVVIIPRRRFTPRSKEGLEPVRNG